MTRVFVGQLDWGSTNDDLENLFSDNGKILKATIITRGRRSLGYGFVDFENAEDAEKAVNALNQTKYKERTLKVELARPPVAPDAQGGEWQQNNNNNTNYRSGPPSVQTSGGRAGRTNFRRNNYSNDNYNNDYNNDYNNNNNNNYNNYPPPRYNNPYNNNNYNNNNNRPPPPRRNPYPVFQQQGQSQAPAPARGGRSFRGRGNSGSYPPRRYQRNQGQGQGQGQGQFQVQGQGQQQQRQYNNYNNRDSAPSLQAPPSADPEKQKGRRRKKPQNSTSENTPAVPKILSKTAVFVANLPFSVSDEALTKIFEDFNVKNAHVVKTKNGRSRGYGFVDFETEQDQKDAITAKNGFEVADDRSTAEKPREARPITVNISHSVAPTEQQ